MVENWKQNTRLQQAKNKLCSFYATRDFTVRVRVRGLCLLCCVVCVVSLKQSKSNKLLLNTLLHLSPQALNYSPLPGLRR